MFFFYRPGTWCISKHCNHADPLSCIELWLYLLHLSFALSLACCFHVSFGFASTLHMRGDWAKALVLHWKNIKQNTWSTENRFNSLMIIGHVSIHPTNFN